MIAEILSVGTELLLGQIVDTDAVYLAQMLSRLGITLYRRTTVGDNPERVKEAMRLALSRADCLLTIGGLGPTMDDLTKEMAAEVLGVGLIEDSAHRLWLEQRAAGRSGGVPPNFYKQALVPQEGRGLPNPTGTALGALFERNGKLVFCLPGPPNELIPMTEQSVEPLLAERTGGARTVIHSRTLKIVGLGESLVEDRLRDLMQADNPTVAPYAKTGEVHLRITARAGDTREAERMIHPVEAAIRTRLGMVVYGADEETLEGATVQMLRLMGHTVATAESCTGGLIAQRITNVPGSSEAFETGVVTYSNPAKQRLLGVPRELLEQHGAVSPEVARAMAEGIRREAGATFGIGVTGIAGPGGGSAEKPVGLVCVGFAWEGGVIAQRHEFLGNRADVRWRSAQAALDLLRRFLIAPEREEFQQP